MKRYLKCIAKLIGRGIGYGMMIWIFLGFCYLLGPFTWAGVGSFIITVFVYMLILTCVYGVVFFVKWAFNPLLLDKKK